MEEIEKIVNELKKFKILYVEDNEAARESTLGIFEEFFGDIVVAVDGLDGLEKFKSNDIDIIITDINMPNMNGLEMIEEIKKFDDKTPVLVLSAHNEPELFTESIRLGVDGYIFKPVDLEQFVNILKKITNQVLTRKRLEYEQNIYKQYQEAIDASSIFSKTDPKGIITHVNDRFCEISEYSREELLGKPHNIVRHPDMPKEVFSEMWDTIKNKKKIWHGIVKNRKKNGGFYYVKATVKPILDKDGNIIEYISLREDITDVMDPKRQLDDLCELYDEMIVVYIKIDDFYDIERFYGSKIARKLEVKFAEYINDILLKEYKFEKVFSLGNGEFAVVRDKNRYEIPMSKVIEQFKKFQEEINDSKIQVEEIDYDIMILVSLSYGKNALEDAKYGLKELYKTNGIFIVSKDLSIVEHTRAEKNLKIIKMIKDAIRNSNIISYYQPIVDNKTKKVVKYESLVRFVDDSFNILPPGAVLEIAKKGRYYSQITSVILDNAFAALEVLEQDISINLSITDIEKKSTREKIYDFIKNNPNLSKKIVFELLEDESVKDFDGVKSFISTVKKYGAKIAIDDFGSGYSNFERLLDYEPDIVKIDGSLVKNIQTSKLSLSIVKTIVRFVKEQEIEIVAEFVENETIYNILKDLGVDYSQGYYFGKPMDLKEIKGNIG